METNENKLVVHLTVAELKSVLTEASISKSEVDKTIIKRDIGGIEIAEEVTGLERNTIYGLTSRKEIPFMKRKGRKKVYFSRKQLTNWLLEGRRKTKKSSNSPRKSKKGTSGNQESK